MNKNILLETLDIPNESLADVSDADLDTIINTAYANIEKIKPLNRSTPRTARVKQLSDTASMDAVDIDAEDQEYTKDEQNRARARKKAVQAYNTGSRPSYSGMKDFMTSLWRAIKNQVNNIEQNDDSWSALNRRDRGEDVLLPGEIQDEKKKKDIPRIQVYFDCSCSFDDSDIDRVKRVMGVLANLEARRKIVIDLYYFAAYLETSFSAARQNSGSTRAWPDMLDTMQSTKPANIIIVTDHDMNNLADRTKKYYTAPGCVWYIWKEDTAPNMLKYVRGRHGTFEFMLD